MVLIYNTHALSDLLTVLFFLGNQQNPTLVQYYSGGKPSDKIGHEKFPRYCYIYLILDPLVDLYMSLPIFYSPMIYYTFRADTIISQLGWKSHKIRFQIFPIVDGNLRFEWIIVLFTSSSLDIHFSVSFALGLRVYLQNLKGTLYYVILPEF